jgi:uncharacterized protein (DUF488 family)
LAERREIFSLGHSTLGYEQFLKLLREAGVDAVADVRTIPFSRHLPHFNQPELRAALKQDGVAYSFLGGELGGRPKRDGVADYQKMAASDRFKTGIDRVLAGAEKFRIALICAEKRPLDCHRCRLVGRELLRRGVDVRHLVSGNASQTQSEIEAQLFVQAGDDLFAAPEERLALAYRRRAMKGALSTAAPSVAAD